jgi:hypothetical protein
MKCFAAALLASVLGIAAANARADEPAKPAPIPSQPAVQAVPPLTDAALLEMIQKMGYEAQIEKTDKGNIYSLNIKRGTWTYIIDVSLSPSKTKLWLSGWLSELPPNEKISVDKLLDLLEGSWTYGPAHFRYHKKFRQLNIGLCLDNREISPAVLREQLESFMETMKKSELLWNAKMWDNTQEVTIGQQPGK